MADDIQQANSGMSFGVNTVNKGMKVVTNNWVILAIVVFFHFLNVGLDLSFIWSPLKYGGMQWFNGLNLTYMIKNIGAVGQSLYLNMILNITFWVIIGFVFIFARGKSWEEFGSKILMVSAAVAMLVLSGISNIGDLTIMRALGTTIEVGLIFLIRQTILKENYDPVQTNNMTTLLIFLDFYAINIVQMGFPAQLDAVNRFVFPVLVLATICYMESSTAKNWLLFGVLLIYLFYFMASSPGVASAFSAGFKGSEKDAASKAPLTLKDNFLKWWEGTKQSWNESQKMISGDYYTGQVEQNQAKPLGVFLEDMKGDTEFLRGETITVWSKLKVQSLQNNNAAGQDSTTINVNVRCFLKNGTRPAIEGEVTPKKGIFNVTAYDEEFLQCEFKGLNLTPGSYPVIFNATFNFDTQSYLKAYYIDKERKRTLMAANVDILSQYGITDSNPTAIYTNGPVKIGMETTNPLPIGVSTQVEDFSSYIGITIDKNWGEGNINNIIKLWVVLPEGTDFGTGCTDFENLPSNEWNAATGSEDTVKVSVYKLKQDKIDADNKKGLTIPKSYKCALKLVNRDTLLGQTPIALKYFKTMISYTYLISQTKNINIKSQTTT